MRRYLVGLVLVWSMLYVQPAQAAEVAEVSVSKQEIINQLLVIVAELQQQIAELISLQATPPTSGAVIAGEPASTIDESSSLLPKLVFYRNLSRGMRGEDIWQLQNLLAKDKALYPEGFHNRDEYITGYYGRLTEFAVKRFQIRHQILTRGTPESNGFGVAGPRTRSLLNQIIGPPKNTSSLASTNDGADPSSIPLDDSNESSSSIATTTHISISDPASSLGSTQTTSSGSQCHLNGEAIPSGESIIMFRNSLVVPPEVCVSQTRTCTNGVLSGTYVYSSCEVFRNSSSNPVSSPPTPPPSSDPKTGSSPDSVVVIDDNLSLVDIVINANAPLAEQEAAEQLQDYLQQVTNVKVPIMATEASEDRIPVYVGNVPSSNYLDSHFDQMKNDGYIIDITASGIYLRGKTELATKYAVSGFLEKYVGVYWFMPDSIVLFPKSVFPDNMGKHIPEKTAIIVPTERVIEEPSFKYRVIGGPHAVDWAVYNGANIKFVFGHSPEKIEGGPQTSRLLHTLAGYVPVEKYANHPEYYAEVDGKLSTPAELLTKKNVKLAIGNPTVRQIVADSVVNMISNYPEIEIIALYPEDNRGYDESTASRLLDGANRSGITIDEMNDPINPLHFMPPDIERVLSRRYNIAYRDIIDRIEAKIGKNHGKVFLNGAYQVYQLPPLESDGIKYGDEAIIFIAHDDDNNHPIRSGVGPLNRRFRDGVKGWQNIYKRLGVLEYTVKSDVTLNLPYPIIHTIREDVPYYRDEGFDFILSQHSVNNLASYNLTFYVMTKLMWDADADVDDIINEYHDKFYGAAAEPMRKYFERWERAVENTEVDFARGQTALFVERITPGLLNELDSYIAQAKALVSDDPLRLARVSLSEHAMHYTRLMAEYIRELKDAFVLNDSEWKYLTPEQESSLAAPYAAKLDQHKNTYFRYRVTLRNHLPRDNWFKVSSAQTFIMRSYFGHPRKLDKSMWAKENGKSLTLGHSEDVKYDIWVYGYDLDGTNTIKEHEIRAVHNGERTLIGGVGNTTGNVRNYGFVLSDLDISPYVVENKLTLEISNPAGSSGISSKIYGVWVMTHDPEITDTKLTKQIQEDISGVRSKALGMIEFEEFNRDGETFTITIPLYVP